MVVSKGRIAALAALIGGLSAAAFVACTSDPGTLPPTPLEGGPQETSTLDSQTPQQDSGPTLYDRLGGHDGLRRFMADILAKELQDPKHASYFALNVGPDPANPTYPYPGHPSLDQIIDCMTDLAGSAIGGPEIYPDKTPSGYVCRDIKTAHAMYAVPNGTFDEFLAMTVEVASARGISSADVGEIEKLFGTQRVLVVADAGLPADASFGFDASAYLDAHDDRFFSSDAGDAADDGGDAADASDGGG